MFLWPPVLWAAGMRLLVLMGGSAWICALLLLPFLRWVHIKQLARGKLPVVTEVGGSAEVLGQKLAANAVLDRPLPHSADAEQERGLLAFDTRLSTLEQAQQELRDETARMVELLKVEADQRREDR